MTSEAVGRPVATEEGKRLRIVHCVGFYFPDSTGGTEVYVRDLVTALSRHSMDGSIIAATDGTYDRYSWNGVEVVRYPIDAPEIQRVTDRDVRRRRTMFQEIVEATRPDLFHLHSWTSGAGLRHLRQVARMDIPSVVTMHVPSPICMRGTMLLNDERPCDGRIDDRRCARCWALDRGLPSPAAYLVAQLPRWDVTDSVISRLSPRAATLLSARAAAATKARQLRSMATLSERIVAPSEWVRAALAENAIPPEKVVVSGQSASAEFSDRKPRPLQGVDRRQIVIGFLGRLERYKGADLLVRALAELPADLPVLLRIAGVGQDARFTRRMEEAARKDPRIQLMGLVEHEKVPEFLADIDVLAVPSRYMETGPIVVQEARALGIPVMGADLGGISERVHHGVDGWLLPFDDPGPWAEAIRVAATDRAEVARLSSNMRRTRSIDDVASDMAKLYREIMAGRPQTAGAWS
ncbi:MAG: glycosyltransferase [Reyranella sp.]|uniref:glycosyltransferase n=1 Tax=Reyranella sp. TaxID=1929291 RepID=UPI0012053C11|nr:glycosyltransferase [Reyranella sp.]TAJ85273.1 MAG: glycosyltransferase [Reyranella sp.]TBR30514.1 MAG: glycosyltransferase [Reyranella sp.]